LALASEDSPSVLRERVTSKGGTTFAALEALRSADLTGTFATALEAARARAQQMGVELGQQ
jgi:pyrroline-5-carboxylate reductase